MAQTKANFTFEENSDGFHLFRNGKRLNTPQGIPLVLPNRRHVEQTIEQLQEQALEAPFYRLMSFATDIHRQATQDELLEHFETDLLCYFTPAPSDLAKLQQQRWQPLIAWAEELGIAPIKTTQNTSPITQPETAKKALKKHLEKLSNRELVGTFVGGKITSSVLTGLALAKQHITADQAHIIAHTDELYQQQRYGEDAELTKNLEANKENLKQIEEFLKLG